MQEALIPEFDEALRIINSGEQVAIRKEVIEKLLAMGYIKHKDNGGWLSSGKGRMYLRKFHNHRQT